MTHHPQRTSKLWLFLLAFAPLPIFFDGSGIYNSLTIGEGRGYPLSIFFSAVFLLSPLYTKFLSRVLFLLIWATICFFIPTFYSVFTGTYAGFDLLMIYLVPLFSAAGLYIGFIKSRLNGTTELAKLFSLVSVPITFFWIIYQADNFLAFGRANGDFWGLFVIYQVWVYWPTMLAILFCLSSFHPIRLRLFLKPLYIFAILFTGAREPLVLIAVFFILSILGQFLRGEIARIKGIVFLSSPFIALGTTYAAITVYPSSVVARKFAQMMSGDASIVGGRLEVLNQFDFITVNPIVGTGFSMTDAIFGSAHNQYLELYYRGGIVGVLALLPVVFVVVRSLFASKFATFECLVASILLVSFNSNVPLRAPYTGVIIWFLIFCLISSRQKAIQINGTKKQPFLQSQQANLSE